MVKTAYAERPVRYEYRLTDKGPGVLGRARGHVPLGQRLALGRANGKGAPVMLVDHETGNEVRPVVVDEHTGKRLDVRRLRVALARRAKKEAQ